MNCLFCNAQDTKVIDSRLITEGSQVRRRRECLQCQERYTTFETAELVLPLIIKRDGSREAFNEDNLRAGVLLSLRKRPVGIENIESSINKIKYKLQSCGLREVSSTMLGEWVMQELRLLDEVAYIRFASVYRCFQDINDFDSEIKNMHVVVKES